MPLLRDTSWDALLAFAEFAEDRNFTHAARRLNLSQPALHNKVATLGAALGLVLYQRQGRQIEITEAGRKVQRFAREVAQAAEEFESELGETRVAVPVSLAAGEGAYLYLLGEGLRSYRAATRQPLRLETATAQAAMEAVLSARVHLGVAPLERGTRQLVSEPLTLVGQVLAVPARHPMAGTSPARLRELDGAQLIVPPAGRPHRTMITTALQSLNVSWEPVIEASGWELMLHFVRLGLGLAIVNACCKIPPGVAVRPLPELPAVQYHVFHGRQPLPRRAEELKAALLHAGDAWKHRSGR